MRKILTAFLVAMLLIASVPALAAPAAGNPGELTVAVKPAVVGIVVTLPANAVSQTPRRFGTGFVYAKETVVTSLDVVKDARRIQVVLPDGKLVDVNVPSGLYSDRGAQVAVLNSPEFTATPAVIGTTDSVHPGEQVAILANPMGAAPYLTETVGVVSGTGRYLKGGLSLIQSDAPLMYGALGAPLVNSRGEVIGMMVDSINEPGLERLNLALPANTLAERADWLIQNKQDRSKLWLGFIAKETRSTEMGIPSDDGLLVTRVFANTPADGKVAEGNVITKVNGKRVQSESDLNSILLTEPQQVTLELRTGPQLANVKTAVVSTEIEPRSLLNQSGIVQKLSLQQFNDALDFAGASLEVPYAKFAQGYLVQSAVAEVLLETEFFRIANAGYIDYRRASGKSMTEFETMHAAGQGKLYVHALIPVQRMNQSEHTEYKGDGLPRLIAVDTDPAQLKVAVPITVSQGNRKLFEGAPGTIPLDSVPLLATTLPPAPATTWVAVTVGFVANDLDPTAQITVDLGKFGKATFKLSELQ